MEATRMVLKGFGLRGGIPMANPNRQKSLECGSMVNRIKALLRTSWKIKEWKVSGWLFELIH